MTRPAAIRALALALPLAGLAALWGWSDYQSRQGTEWDVPVQGYDPRDLLRGHYVQFRYDWPGLAQADPEDPAIWSVGAELCLEGPAPQVTRVTIVPDPAAEGQSVSCANRARAEASFDGQPTGTAGGRLYVPQAQADELNAKLADPALQGVVRVRLRPDGHLTPLRLTFRPRPVQPPQ